MNLEDRFLEKVESMEDNLIRLTRSLVKTLSINPPGDERGVSRVVGEELDSMGLDVEYVESKANRINTLGRLKGTGGGKNFLWNGHYDTVPVSNIERWTMDPFGAVIKDGRIYGRGSGDMKGALASAIIAVKGIVDLGVQLKGDLSIHAVADEEYFGRYGTRFLVEKGYVSRNMADMAIVGEGSVYKGHIYARTAVRGRHIIRITTKGKAAHSSSPELGINAVLKMGKVLQSLDEHQFIFPRHRLLPDPTIAPGTLIEGGTKDNIIPEKCISTSDLRTVPGMDSQKIIEEIRGKINDLKNEDPELDAEAEIFLEKPPSEISPEEEVFKLANLSVKKVVGYELKPRGTSGSNDTSWLTNLANIPSMALGPGGGNAHGADEWVEVKSLIDFAKIYGLMFMNACGARI